ncbi:3972_t:CDS:2 [Entrophospora sp. SA101]|nr:81_t:CDS:2 [Entrophospora sp. SA101]CAJ0844712.1 3972_t:CDS:2 [Entrophospora sp. SA101]CAJ0849070.1 7671_t:CDS:2 [Entrophospora sp. SA101]
MSIQQFKELQLRHVLELYQLLYQQNQYKKTKLLELKQQLERQLEQQLEQHLEQHLEQQLEQQLKQQFEQQGMQLLRKQDQEFRLFLHPASQKIEKDKMRPRKYSLHACNSCCRAHQACVIEESSASCSRCIEKNFECTFKRIRKKRGRPKKKSKENSNGHQCCYSSNEPIPDLREGSSAF